MTDCQRCLNLLEHNPSEWVTFRSGVRHKVHRILAPGAYLACCGRQSVLPVIEGDRLVWTEEASP